MTTKRKKEEKRLPCCPYCDTEIMAADFPFCRSCQATIFYCPECRQPLSRDKAVCPHCGAEIRANRS